MRDSKKMVSGLFSPRALKSHLRRGGVIAYATRAVFGLGCDPRNLAGLRRLTRLKGRPAHKGMIVVADRMERLKAFHVPLNDELRDKCLAKWPGPHTWLVPAAVRTPGLLCGRRRWPDGGRRVAIRVDAHPDVVRLCSRLQMALVSTSANRSGQHPARTARECLRRFGSQVRVIPGRVIRGERPSTIADLLSKQVIRS